MTGTLWRTFVARLRWIDGTPLSANLEPYRMRLFEQAFDSVDEQGRPVYNLIVSGRGKKNYKTADLVLASLFALVTEPSAGHDNEVFILANDKDQARDDLTLAKKLIAVNDGLGAWLKVKRDSIERRDGGGFLEVLPAQDVAGSHGKTYRLAGFDEIHSFRTWDLFEALQFDPTRADSQMWITSYASLFHRPGVPLFDLMLQGKAGTDPRMLFSWYAADFTTDPDFANLTPEQRANPSMTSWNDGEYLAQQQRRLPSHKYRRLHLNLPGLPEGSAYQPEPVMDAIDRGVTVRRPERGITYVAFVDMSGGSSDDAVLSIGHRDADGRAVIDLIDNQGAPQPFNPIKAVERFTRTLKDYGVRRVTGDRYAGETFRAEFGEGSIQYIVATESKSELYEALEPVLNAGAIVLLDVPQLEQQLMGLLWRGGKIDHQPGEHDDYANAAAGVARLLQAGRTDSQAAEVARNCLSIGTDEVRGHRGGSRPMASDGCPRP